jgi:hypothetical protein
MTTIHGRGVPNTAQTNLNIKKNNGRGSKETTGRIEEIEGESLKMAPYGT